MKRNSEIWLFAGAYISLPPFLILRDYTPSNELRYPSIADEAMRNLWLIHKSRSQEG